MAKIVATYDSETKEISVTIDGVDQGPTAYFSCYSEKYHDGSCCGGCSVESAAQKENGVTYRHSAHASKYLPSMTEQEKLELYFREALHRK